MALSFVGILNSRELKRHIAYDFEVPPGTSQLRIRFEFTPLQVDGFDNQLSLTLFDPDGFRGAGHRGGALHEVVLSQAAATAGYIAGPVKPGIWQVVIDVHILLPGEPVHYQL